MQSASFYEIKDEHVTIGDRLVYRARFGLHLKLANLSQKFSDSFKTENVEQCCLTLKEYFDLNDLKVDAGFENIYQLLVLFSLNELKFTLPFMLNNNPVVESNLLPYEYEGRTWVYWIHKIAKCYNWTKDYIMSLFPEDVICFIQEITMDEYEQLDIVRIHSQVAYTYDEGSKKYKYIPMVKPSWMMEEKIVPIRKVSKMALPMGNIVDLNNLPN